MFRGRLRLQELRYLEIFGYLANFEQKLALNTHLKILGLSKIYDKCAKFDF